MPSTARAASGVSPSTMPASQRSAARSTCFSTGPKARTCSTTSLSTGRADHRRGGHRRQRPARQDLALRPGRRRSDADRGARSGSVHARLTDLHHEGRRDFWCHRRLEHPRRGLVSTRRPGARSEQRNRARRRRSAPRDARAVGQVSQVTPRRPPSRRRPREHGGLRRLHHFDSPSWPHRFPVLSK